MRNTGKPPGWPGSQCLRCCIPGWVLINQGLLQSGVYVCDWWGGRPSRVRIAAVPPQKGGRSSHSHAGVVRLRLDAGRTIYCVPPHGLNQPLLRAPPSGVDASNVSGCGSKYVSVCSGVALELGAHVCGWRPQQQAYQSLRRADVVLPRETASHQRGVYLLHKLLSGLTMCRAFENNMCRAVYNRFSACVQVVSAVCGNAAALFVHEAVV